MQILDPISNDMCLEMIGLTCSMFVNHSKLNDEHSWRDLYDHIAHEERATVCWLQVGQKMLNKNEIMVIKYGCQLVELGWAILVC